MAKEQFKYISSTIAQSGCKGCGKRPLSGYDWMSDLTEDVQQNKYIEVQFKNTRKQIFTNPRGLELHKEDIVAVEGSPGVDVGYVTLTGTLAALRFRKLHEMAKQQVRQIYRLATSEDIHRWKEAQSLEHSTMIESRRIANKLGLNMKIGDVEYQGDGMKAIFYYIADTRVDFRQLIRVLADTFHVRIEMKQIGARQEAARIGGIGPCGRPLCCTQWMTTFKSVNTSATRFQGLPLNPDRLTGQCAKLKCCGNFEVNTYMEAQKQMPNREVTLKTEEGEYFFFKKDLLRLEITYSPKKFSPIDAVTISAERAKEIIAMNERGELPPTLLLESEQEKPQSTDILAENSINRFDKVLKSNRKRRGNNTNRSNKQRNNTPRQRTSSDEKGKEQQERHSSEHHNSRRRKQSNRREDGEKRHSSESQKTDNKPS